MIQNANGDHHSQLSDLKSDDNEETVYVIRYNEEVDETDESLEDEKDTRETSKKYQLFFAYHVIKCKIDSQRNNIISHISVSSCAYFLLLFVNSKLYSRII